MTDHLAVLEELAKKWRSEFTGGDDRELKEIGYDACLLDCADELDAAIALMRGQSDVAAPAPRTNEPGLPPGYRWLDPEIDMLTKEEADRLRLQEAARLRR